MTKQELAIPRWAAEEFETARLRIIPPESAWRLWERQLTAPERGKLGGDFEVAYHRHRTAGMWMALRGVTYQRAVIDVAQVLGFLTGENGDSLLRAIHESRDPEEAREQAIDAGSLVLSDCPRTMWFGGHEVDVDWERHDSLWVFLWQLVRCAKAGCPVDRWSFGNRAHRNIVTDRKSKLSKLEGFPIEIINQIEVRGNGSQQLCLPREQIRVFEDFGERLREWNP